MPTVRYDFEDYAKKLDPFRIATAVNWLELPDTDKQAIKLAGLPEAVINDLNKAVRQGLLLPAFKYYDEVKFMEDHLIKMPSTAVHDEAMTVVQCAQQVDDGWVLTRKDCDVLCHNYQRMVEWTMKCTLQGWNTKGDSRIFRNPKKYQVTITSYTTPGRKKQHSFWVRYPTQHNLYTLGNSVSDETSFKLVGDSIALDRITMCAMGDRISCREFFDHAQHVDPYLLAAWQFMKNTPPTKLAKPRPKT